ncbi:sperm-associated antigen 1-like [Chenopodium quinoa]|uniref:sperm-associated antigen 1-like n=1 Tax=Chenopodium quinoa TaxID=63459 RepID=UPI000B786746|nr:sperm-associated antigen 1-like [Chenopodium quinoa]
MATTPPLNKVERAHQMYREGRYREALGFYSDAVVVAKTKAQKIALHSNRAACFLKLHDFKMAADECTSVLELDHKHTGALMLRAQTLVTLKEYQSALFDVNRLLELNPSSEVYLNLQARLKTQLSLSPIPEVDSELEEDDEDINEDTLKSSEQEDGENNYVEDSTGIVEKPEPNVHTSNGFITPESNGSLKAADPHSKGWQTIPKPKGHSRLDYSRWDSVEDGSSEDDDDNDADEEIQPHFRFRVKTVDVRPVK